MQQTILRRWVETRDLDCVAGEGWGGTGEGKPEGDRMMPRSLSGVIGVLVEG
jgi:hypothetical protein